VQVNIIPRDGGNTFSGSLSGDFTGGGLQNDNVTDELIARGLTPSPSVKQFYDVGGGIGGPIQQNKLWFFGASRFLMRQQYQQGNYFNKRQGTLFYEADLDHQAFTDDWDDDYSVRLTWQAAPKHKIAVSHSQHPSCQCYYGLLEALGGTLLAPEATGAHHYDPNYLSAGTWSFPATNRLLFEAAVAYRKYNNFQKRQPEATPDVISVTDQALNLTYGARSTSYRPQPRESFRQRLAVSYVTGSHAVKAGLDLNQYWNGRPVTEIADPNQINQARDYTFRNQSSPQSVRIHSVPFGTQDNSRDIGAYVQDQWTVRKLTLNVGVRYGDFDASIPAQFLPAGPFVGERSFDPVEHTPSWKNLNPRLGAAYDVFGNGRTALKGSLGRYSRFLQDAANNPVSNQATSTSRNWNDSRFGPGDPRTGNFIPDCDLLNPDVSGECDGWSERTFGQIRQSNTRSAEDAISGFNRQPETNWQGSLSIQHELRPGLGVNVGYFRTWYSHFLATDNELWTPADFDSFCITAPMDDRLPNSGQRLCGLYDIKPDKFGQTANLVTQADHYGKQTEVFNGVDVTINARFAEGGQISGGLSVGRTTTNNCFTVDSPQTELQGYGGPGEFCDITPPWSSGTQLKLAAVYPLPWRLQTSAIYQNIPGIPITASYVASNAEIQSSLGRNLGSCRGAATCNGTVTLNLIPTNTLFEDRLQQLDLRLTRIFQLTGTTRVQGSIDVYNVFNASNILNMNSRYGDSWQNVIQIMGGRMLKFSGRLDF
jgi:hypothetical protein